MIHIKDTLVDVIKKNLPEKKRDPKEYSTYLHMDIQGFNQALSQINISLIADEVLKVVKQSLKDGLLKRMMKYDSKDGYSVLHDEIIEKVYEDVEDLLSSLSPNKENKNNG